MSRRKANNSRAVLKDIYARYISISPAEKKEKVALVEFIKNELIPLMKKKDELFCLLFQEIFHTGSYYDGLRVNNANEYDINILLRLPGIKESSMQFEDDGCDSGFATLTILGNVQDHLQVQQKMYNSVQLLQRKLLEQGKDGWILMPDKTRRWLQSILCKALNDVELKKSYNKHGIESIALKESGPAMTLQIQLQSSCQVDVDMVPVFVFKCRQILDLNHIGDALKLFWESHMDTEFKEFGTLAIDENFFMVPKSKYQNSPEWRLSFTDIERKILHQHGCAKMVIKLLKYFRDCNHLIQGLSSYSLKTLVMLMIRKEPQFEWKEEELPAIFLKTLKYLHEVLEKQFLPFYFHPGSNIFDKLSSSHMFNMKSWIAKVIKKLENTKDTETCKLTWYSYFNVEQDSISESDIENIDNGNDSFSGYAVDGPISSRENGSETNLGMDRAMVIGGVGLITLGAALVAASMIKPNVRGKR